MLLAGNFPSTTPKPAPSTAPVQAAMPRSSVPERQAVHQPYATTPRRSSPVHVAPISIPQSTGRAVIRTDNNAAKQSGAGLSSPIHAEPLKSVMPLRSANFLSSGYFYLRGPSSILTLHISCPRHSYLPLQCCFQTLSLSFVGNLWPDSWRSVKRGNF